MHILFRLPDAQATDTIARETEVGQKASALPPKIRENASLYDTEKSLIGAGMGSPTPFCPEMSALQSVFHVVTVIRDGTLILSLERRGAPSRRGESGRRLPRH